MGKSRLPLLAFTLILFLSVAWLKHQQTKTQIATQNIARDSSHQFQKSVSQKKEDMAAIPVPKVDLQNSRHMTQILRHSVYQPDIKKTLFLLQKANTRPLYLKDENPFTGVFHVIKTETPLKGTRHFHAQFFSQKNTKPFLQHMSFEIPPGKSSFPTAVALLKDAFKDLPAHPEIQKDGFMLWHWKGSYNVWVLRLTKDHIQSDPFNAYAPEDEGSIRIAVEMDVPHDHAQF